ncbi:MAG: CBS domain-containing protein [Rhodospirillaceae bacterium]
MAGDTSSQSDVRVGSVINRAAVLVHPDHPLTEALHRMHEGGVPIAPVVDGDEIVGVVSEAAAAGHAPDAAVREAMATTFPFLYEHDSCAMASGLAAATGASHIAVVDADRRLVGIVAARADRAVAPPALDDEQVAQRMAAHPTRATATPLGDPGGYADAPRLYVRSQSTPATDGPLDVRAHPEEDRAAQESSRPPHVPKGAHGSR